jgi:hypothetical protein
MSMLARYKKAGGIIELVKLIEDSGEPKRSQLIAMIRQEDPEFAARVESRIFSYEMLHTLPENLLAEIVASCSPKVLAISLATETDEVFIKLCERCLGQNFSEYKSEKEVAQSSALTPSQIEAGRKKLISTARKLESEGRIKLPFSDSGGGPAAPGKLAGTDSGATGLGAEGAGGSDETELSGCPAIETFGMEAPPPGLGGERLENFFKQNLEVKPG